MTKLNPGDYTYHLPEERIAKFPLENRADSKLLVYKDHEIDHLHFRDLASQIPSGSTLFFNETRVIPARLIMQRETGAQIEIFLLEPVLPSRIMLEVMASKHTVSWNCMIGNLKKWKDNEVLRLQLSDAGNEINLSAELIDRETRTVKLTWDNENMAFSDIITLTGKIPLPPYIRRDVQESDRERYQTVYSKTEGAVAAPTAGLHFTPEILDQLSANNVELSHLTLHVSAGTFQPIKVDDAMEHPMHSEQIVVYRENLLALKRAKKVFAVGTTSMRTLESLFWYGQMLCNDPMADFSIPKLFPYKQEEVHSLDAVIDALIRKMDQHETDTLVGDTEIFIFPGYEFRVCDALITNYHLPGSTLILLVAAFTGQDWRKIYESALENDYRFLSYGDSSLLFRQ